MSSKTKEGLQMIALLALASLAAALPLSQSSSPEQEERAVHGAQAYRIYCASCHGLAAEGDGPMAQALTTRPADLTRIRERYGTFPDDRIAATIDGRAEVLSHGPGSMPVWGLSFREPGSDSDQEREVREKIRDLVAYLKSIQK